VRSGPSDTVMAGNIGRSVRVSSWLGGTLLSGLVPVLGGSFEESDGQEIPERITIDVPVDDVGTSWDPTTNTRHPLADFGQRLYVVATLSTPRGASWEIPLGWFQVDSWNLSDDESTVSVKAIGLLQVVADDKLRGPEQPRTGGTFVSEFRRLMPGGIPVSIDAALVDRVCPSSFTWDEDRLSALYDLADAWPARIVTGSDGTVMVKPPLGLLPVPVLTLTDGASGVLMFAPRGSSRAGRYSVVVARSSADTAASAPVEGEYVTTAGPYAVATYGTVRRRYASPLLGTSAAATAAAQTIAQTSQTQGRVITVTLPPDPRIQRGDPVKLMWGSAVYLGWVQSVKLPLTVDGSPMQITVGVPL
jgi:hypothetical protein